MTGSEDIFANRRELYDLSEVTCKNGEDICCCPTAMKSLPSQGHINGITYSSLFCRNDADSLKNFLMDHEQRSVLKMRMAISSAKVDEDDRGKRYFTSMSSKEGAKFNLGSEGSVDSTHINAKIHSALHFGIPLRACVQLPTEWIFGQMR